MEEAAAEGQQITPTPAEAATGDDPFRADLHHLVRIALELGEVLGQAYADEAPKTMETEAPLRTWLVYTHGQETPSTVRSRTGPRPSYLGEGYVCIGTAHFSGVRSIEEVNDGQQAPRGENGPAQPGDDDFAMANGATFNVEEELRQMRADIHDLQSAPLIVRNAANDEPVASTLQQFHKKPVADSRSLLYSRAQTLRGKANLLDAIASRLPDLGGELDEELATLLARGLDRF